MTERQSMREGAVSMWREQAEREAVKRESQARRDQRRAKRSPLVSEMLRGPSTQAGFFGRMLGR